MAERPTCRAVMSHEIPCGKPATHHIPEAGEYAYKTTDTHLCEAHATEALNRGKKPVRRWRPRPTEE